MVRLKGTDEEVMREIKVTREREGLGGKFCVGLGCGTTSYDNPYQILASQAPAVGVWMPIRKLIKYNN